MSRQSFRIILYILAFASIWFAIMCLNMKMPPSDFFVSFTVCVAGLAITAKDEPIPPSDAARSWSWFG